MSKRMISGRGADLLRRPLREATVGEISDLLLRASKDPSEWRIGAEIELFAFHLSNQAPVEYATMHKVLETLASSWNMEPEYETNGVLIGLHGHGAAISLEPGGQLELATKPHDTLRALRKEICSYVSQLHATGEARDVGFWAMGYQPFETRDSMPKMPKPRYDLMRDHYAREGGRGLDMMHCTASVQCAVDFGDERNMADKIRTAARVSPFLSALVAASPFSEGKPNGFKTTRYQVWLETGMDRSGIWPEMLDAEGLTYRRYIERALRAPPIYFWRKNDYARVHDPRPFMHYVEHGFEGTIVTVNDLVDHLTTFFPEIRPKGYVELRGADCVRPEEAVAIAGFWRALLDDEDVRRSVDERLAAMGYAEVRALQPEVARRGLEADSAAGPVLEVARWLTRTAHTQLGRRPTDCAQCLEPLLERAERGRSPADDMLEVAARTSVREAITAAVV